MSYLNIPAELRGEKAWVNVWDGSKVPMQATVRKAASSSNPDTWSNYIDAEHNVQHGYYDGLGYVFHDTGVVGIDIDDGFTDGLLNPLAADIIGVVVTPTRKSPGAGEGFTFSFVVNCPSRAKITVPPWRFTRVIGTSS